MRTGLPAVLFVHTNRASTSYVSGCADTAPSSSDTVIDYSLKNTLTPLVFFKRIQQIKRVRAN